MPDFLLEIGLEEIPARMIEGAEEELHRRLGEVLTRESLTDKSDIEKFSTPRRLALLARGIRDAQEDAEETLKGPSVQVAFKNGEPQMPAIKFAEKAGVDVSKLERTKDAKGEYISARVTRKGRSAEQILSEALPKELNALYWAKNMYWRAGKPERFVRPVRWMVAMLGGKVVPLEYAGIKAGNTSRGHRLLGAPHGAQGFAEVAIPDPSGYAARLKEAGVIARRSERVDLIRKALDKATRAVPGARWREDASLLATVVDITEFPGVILGNFDPEFLALPEEVLVTVMRDHQKYFAVEDKSGKLAPHFLAVMNTGDDPQGIIQHGHERVLRARFNDARFFWDTDQKHALRDRVEWLKNVTFQKDLGSYYDKTQRVVRLAGKIAQAVDGQPSTIDPNALREAANLAKTDLTTELVKEFTELQGVVGGLYAKAQGLDSAIGDAIYDQYKPESMEDEVPRTIEGAVLSIADKADSIAGMFALGLVPSGSKDPFALRRQANGIVKMVAEKRIAIGLQSVFVDALKEFSGSEAEKRFNAASYREDISSFFDERLEFYLRDVKGFAYDVVNAVLAVGADDVADVIARAEAVAKVRPSPDFEAIGAAFKRIKNILRQASETQKRVAEKFDPAQVTDQAERALAEVTAQVAPRVRQLAGKREYAAALVEISKIRPAVDTFFDKVMVMVEDEKVRANRLALLQSLLNEFSTIADFSEIVTEKKQA